MKKPDDWVFLPETLSRQPLGPHTRQGDDRWTNIVKWTHFAMLEAEELGITKANKAILQSDNPAMAVVDGVQATWGWTKLTFMGIVKMITREISPDNIGGPLTIAKISGDAASQGFSNYIFLIAILSINLGVLNLLPIPVLDGGHLAFFTLEAVLRRPVSIRSREVAQQVGIFLLICLMLYAFRNDILNVWPK